MLRSIVTATTNSDIITRYRWSRLLLPVAALFVAVFLGSSAQALMEQKSATVSLQINDTALVIDGLSSPGAFVRFIEGNNLIGTTTADSLGRFSQTFAAQTPGIHTIGIIATDSIGRLTDIVYQSIHLSAFNTTSFQVFLPTTISLTAPEVEVGHHIVVSGQTIPNGRVTITIDNDQYLSVQSDATGNWSYRLAGSDYSIGDHTITAVVQSAPGQQSLPTAALPFTVISELPFGVPAKPNPPTITSPSTGDVVEGGKVVITGTSQPGMQIEIWNHGVPIGSVFADDKGNWSLPLDLTEFAYEIVARACDQMVCSDFSPPVSFMLKHPPAAGLMKLTLDKYRFYSDASNPIIVRANVTGGTSDYQLTFEWDDGTRDILKTGEASTTLAHQYDRAGRYGGTVTAIDANGTTREAHFSAYIVSQNPLWYWWYWLISLILWTYLIGWVYTHRRRRLKPEKKLATSKE